jgi:hypothetical protein
MDLRGGLDLHEAAAGGTWRRCQLDVLGEKGGG